jgi:hypothetical protein
MRKKIILSSSLAALLAVALAAPLSRASLIVSFPKRFTASACAQVSSGNLFYASDGALANNAPLGTPDIVIDCPVLSHAFGSPLDPLDLYYLDNSDSAIVCTYRAEARDSTAVNQQTLSSGSHDNLFHKMTFQVTTINDGFTHIRCTLPPRDSAGNLSFLMGYAGW